MKLTNTDLFTANFLIPVTPILEKQGKVSRLMRVWAVTYIGNFIGAAAGVPFNVAARFMHLGLPGTVGNMAGGVLVIAVLYYLHLLHSRKSLSDYRKLRDIVLEKAARRQIRL